MDSVVFIIYAIIVCSAITIIFTYVIWSICSTVCTKKNRIEAQVGDNWMIGAREQTRQVGLPQLRHDAENGKQCFLNTLLIRPFICSTFAGTCSGIFTVSNSPCCRWNSIYGHHHLHQNENVTGGKKIQKGSF